MTNAWEFCEPEGTPLRPLARDKWGPVNDRQRKRDTALTAHFEDESDGELIAVRESTPNLMSTLKRAQEAVMTATPVDAPYGYKADGTPKKSNGGRKPKNATVEALAAVPALTDEPDLEPDPPATCEPALDATDPIAGAVSAIDAKIASIEDERTAIEVRKQDLEDYLRELADARHSLAAHRERFLMAKNALMDLAA